MSLDSETLNDHVKTYLCDYVLTIGHIECWLLKVLDNLTPPPRNYEIDPIWGNPGGWDRSLAEITAKLFPRVRRFPIGHGAWSISHVKMYKGHPHGGYLLKSVFSGIVCLIMGNYLERKVILACLFNFVILWKGNFTVYGFILYQIQT